MQWQPTDQVQPHGHDQDFYTWKEFRCNVLDLCPVDNKRLGLERYLPLILREGVIDLQQFIPAYNKRHETLYYPQDFATEGEASVGTLPPKADIQSVWLCDLARSQRFPVKAYDWERRFDMIYRRKGPAELFPNLITLTAAAVQAIELINRLPALESIETHRHGLMAVDPQSETFYLVPRIQQGWVLDVHWNGRKLDFKDEELVPFDEEAAYAVAAWVKAKIAFQIDRDPNRSQEFMRDYLLSRTNLYLTLKEQNNLITK